MVYIIITTTLSCKKEDSKNVKTKSKPSTSSSIANTNTTINTQNIDNNQNNNSQNLSLSNNVSIPIQHNIFNNNSNQPTFSSLAQSQDSNTYQITQSHSNNNSISNKRKRNFSELNSSSINNFNYGNTNILSQNLNNYYNVNPDLSAPNPYNVNSKKRRLNNYKYVPNNLKTKRTKYINLILSNQYPYFKYQYNSPSYFHCLKPFSPKYPLKIDPTTEELLDDLEENLISVIEEMKILDSNLNSEPSCNLCKQIKKFLYFFSDSYRLENNSHLVNNFRTYLEAIFLDEEHLEKREFYYNRLYLKLFIEFRDNVFHSDKFAPIKEYVTSCQSFAKNMIRKINSYDLFDKERQETLFGNTFWKTGISSKFFPQIEFLKKLIDDYNNGMTNVKTLKKIQHDLYYGVIDGAFEQLRKTIPIYRTKSKFLNIFGNRFMHFCRIFEILLKKIYNEQSSIKEHILPIHKEFLKMIYNVLNKDHLIDNSTIYTSYKHEFTIIRDIFCTKLFKSIEKMLNETEYNQLINLYLDECPSLPISDLQFLFRGVRGDILPILKTEILNQTNDHLQLKMLLEILKDMRVQYKKDSESLSIYTQYISKKSNNQLFIYNTRDLGDYIDLINKESQDRTRYLVNILIECIDRIYRDKDKSKPLISDSILGLNCNIYPYDLMLYFPEAYDYFMYFEQRNPCLTLIFNGLQRSGYTIEDKLPTPITNLFLESGFGAEESCNDQACHIFYLISKGILNLQNKKNPLMLLIDEIYGKKSERNFELQDHMILAILKVYLSNFRNNFKYDYFNMREILLNGNIQKIFEEYGIINDIVKIIAEYSYVEYVHYSHFDRLLKYIKLGKKNMEKNTERKSNDGSTYSQYKDEIEDYNKIIKILRNPIGNNLGKEYFNLYNFFYWEYDPESDME